MKTWGLLFVIAGFSFLKSNAQDVITLKNGEEVKAKVTEVTISEIKYTKFDNPDGSLYTLLKTEVFMIKYENGAKDVFKNTDTESTPREKRRARRTVVDNPSLWNYDIINFMENPALSGEDRRHNITLDLSSDRSEDDSKVGYDFLLTPKSFKKPMSVGLGAYFSHRSYSFASNVRRTFGIASSFKYELQDSSSLSAGLSLGLVNVYSSSFSDYNFFEANYGGAIYYPTIDPEEWDSLTYEAHFVRFGPMNVGAWYHAKNYFAGITVNNITRYNENVYGESHPSPVYFSAAAGYHFNIRDKATLTPSVVYRTRNFMLHRIDPRLTVSFSKSRLLVGTYYQNKAVYGMFGADICTYFQLVRSAGGSVAREGRTDLGYFASTFRIHFTTGKNKTSPGKL